MCFWRGHRNSGFFRFYRNFLQEFLWAGIPVFTQDSGGFHRISEESRGFLFPPKTVWLRPATRKSTLLSKIWTKIDIFNLSPNRT
jgi:hypothetical protein